MVWCRWRGTIYSAHSAGAYGVVVFEASMRQLRWNGILVNFAVVHRACLPNGLSWRAGASPKPALAQSSFRILQSRPWNATNAAPTNSGRIATASPFALRSELCSGGVCLTLRSRWAICSHFVGRSCTLAVQGPRPLVRAIVRRPHGHLHRDRRLWTACQPRNSVGPTDRQVHGRKR